MIQYLQLEHSVPVGCNCFMITFIHIILMEHWTNEIIKLVLLFLYCQTRFAVSLFRYENCTQFEPGFINDKLVEPSLGFVVSLAVVHLYLFLTSPFLNGLVLYFASFIIHHSFIRQV